ncbi:MAG: hypothetical protein K940chlam7_01266 [Chlamydiae bacterium]|nr:hypothetical protein [Chlamydiota bacterium]
MGISSLAPPTSQHTSSDEHHTSGNISTSALSQRLLNSPEEVTFPQKPMNSVDQKTSPLAKRIDTIVHEKEKSKTPCASDEPALATKKLLLCDLFAVPNFKDIPFDKTGELLLEREQEEWKDKLCYGETDSPNIPYTPSADTADYFKLAQSLLNRFLQKHPFLNRERCLPTLRFTALRIAIKYLDEHSTNLEDFDGWVPKEVPFKKLNQMESTFLEALDWTIELL